MLIYVAITGFSLSVVRAAIMLTSVAITYFIWCDNDSVTALFIAAFLICLISPYSIANVSFLLSFLATFGVLSYSELTFLNEREKRALEKLKEALQ